MVNQNEESTQERLGHAGMGGICDCLLSDRTHQTTAICWIKLTNKQASTPTSKQASTPTLGASWHKAHGHLTESGWRCCQAQQEALTASLLQLDLCSGRLKGAVCSACAARGRRQGHSTQCDTALLAEPGGRRVELLG